MDIDLRLLRFIQRYEPRSSGRVNWYSLRFFTPDELAPYRNQVDALRQLAQKGYLEPAPDWPEGNYQLSVAGKHLLDEHDGS